MDDAGVVGLVDAFEYSVQSGISVAMREPRLIRERTSLGETALHLLVLGDSIDAVRAFLALGAEADALCCMGNTPLMLAASLGRSSVAKLLLGAGARVWVDGQIEPTLHKAVRGGDLETVQVVLDAGAEVNEQTDFAEAPAHVAAEENLVAILKLLISRGADVSLQSTFGGTPLDVAREHGSLACVELLSPRQ